MSQEYRTQNEIVSTVSVPSLALLEDNFEATTVKWSAEASGGFFGGLFTTDAYNGNTSYRMQTRSAAAVNGDFQGIVRFIGLSQKNKINFSLRIRNFATNSRGGELQFSFTVRGVLRDTTYEIRLIPLSNVLQYRDSTNTMQTLAGYTLPNQDDIWTRVEIQFNLATERYEYVVVGRTIANLSGIQAYGVTTATTRSDMAVRVRSVQSEAAGLIGTDVRVDDIVILTPDN